MESKPMITQRLRDVRAWMEKESLAALIVFTSDPHNGEYIPERWKLREWLTGFTGSAGTAVVTAREARMWTDSRYFIQAAEQLDGTPFALMKEGTDGVPDAGQWLAEQLEAGARVGFVGEQAPLSLIENLQTADAPQLEWVNCPDPFDALWPQRPALPLEPLRLQAMEFAGRRAADKMADIMQAVENHTGCSCFLMNDLAEIAWTLNLRGSDVEYNPVFVSYLLLERGKATLFVDKRKVTADIEEYLEGENVAVAGYGELHEKLRLCGKDGSTVGVPHPINYGTVDFMRRENIKYRSCLSPAEMLKAVKNEAELAGMRQAMERDGVALVKFRRWLDEKAAQGLDGLTEMGIDRELTRLRSKQPGFEGLSFATIAGYAAHGAIVHYEAEPDTDATLRPEGLLLLDSGAQYAGGTTDITRTIALGPVTEEERRAYTLVLKGHIALSRCRFPAGTTGLQLDLAARYAMWQEGYDFGHGTGHGVGAHLCVHEGPHQIRKNRRACTLVDLRPGMVVTDEPGIYVEGRFGVRIENTLAVRQSAITPFGDFLEFEPLTLCPIDMAPVEKDLLTAAEIAWLNDYHRTVRTRLMPLLADEADRRWLEEATREVAV